MVVRYLVCLVLIGFLGCSRENVITKATETQNNTVFENSIPSVTPAITPTPESPVKPVGHFTNIKSNGEHQWGVYIEFWRQDDKIYGWMSGSDYSRIVGDAPAGILEDVQFDSKTGKLSFRAKLSWNVYEFDGFLTKNKLTGNLLIINGLCGDSCTKKKKIILPKSKNRSSNMEEFRNFESYQEWKAYMDEIL